PATALPLTLWVYLVIRPELIEYPSLSPEPNVTLVTCCAGLYAVAVTGLDRKSTRLNSSHVSISYAVFCLKKKNTSRKSARPLLHNLHVSVMFIFFLSFSDSTRHLHSFPTRRSSDLPATALPLTLWVYLVIRPELIEYPSLSPEPNVTLVTCCAGLYAVAVTG